VSLQTMNTTKLKESSSSKANMEEAVAVAEKKERSRLSSQKYRDKQVAAAAAAAAAAALEPAPEAAGLPSSPTSNDVSVVIKQPKTPMPPIDADAEAAQLQEVPKQKAEINQLEKVLEGTLAKLNAATKEKGTLAKQVEQAAKKMRLFAEEVSARPPASAPARLTDGRLPCVADRKQPRSSSWRARSQTSRNRSRGTPPSSVRTPSPPARPPAPRPSHPAAELLHLAPIDRRDRQERVQDRRDEPRGRERL
jgi:hypothetical protein